MKTYLKNNSWVAEAISPEVEDDKSELIVAYGQTKEEATEALKLKFIDEFKQKMKQKNYTVKHRKIEEIMDMLVISEDKYHHIAIKTERIIEAPFDYILEYIEHEMDNLKKRKEK